MLVDNNQYFFYNFYMIVVNNKGGKGNPNHDEKTGEFTSPGSSSSGFSAIDKKLLDMITKKKAMKENMVMGKNYDNELKNVIFPSLITNSLKKDGVVKSFNSGTDKAKDLVLALIKDYGVKIDYENGENKFSKNTGNVYFANPNLTGEGKYAGYHNEGETFYHEFFHALDFKFFGSNSIFSYETNSISTKHVLSNGKTLKKIFADEISDNKYGYSLKMFKEIKAEYEAEKDKALREIYSEEEIAKLKEDADILTKVNKAHKEGKYPNYKAYYDDFYEKKNSIEQPALAKLRVGKNVADRKYSVLSDFCSYLYNTGVGKNSICGGHTKKYWKDYSGDRPIVEMFAELGSMWARNDNEGIERIRKYFPNTVEGFYEIVNNLDKIRGEKK